MIFKNKETKKAVIFLSNDVVKYVVMSKVKNKYHIGSYDQAELKEGVIKHNEVLELDFLSQVLSQIQEKINIKNIDVLLPHNFFEHKKINLDIPYTSKRKMKKALHKYVIADMEKYSWIATHSFETIFYKQGNTVEAHIQMLAQDNYRALKHSFEKAGFEMGVIHSEDFSFTHIFSETENTLHVRFGDESTNVSLFEKGIYVEDEDFTVSYNFLESIIQKYSTEYRDNISGGLKKNGIKNTYDDKNIVSKMSHSFDVLLQHLKKNIQDFNHVQVSFESYEIPGVMDMLNKNIKNGVTLVNPVRTSKYIFDDVLSIHRDEIPTYTTCILYLLGKK